MLAKALLCIAAAIHFTEMTPKGKYFLIETQDKGETGDDGKTGDNGETMDSQETEDDYNIGISSLPTLNPGPINLEPKDKTDYSETMEDPPKPMMTKEGI